MCTDLPPNGLVRPGQGRVAVTAAHRSCLTAPVVSRRASLFLSLSLSHFLSLTHFLSLSLSTSLSLFLSP